MNDVIYDQVTSEIKSLIAKVQERYGVSSILVCWRARDEDGQMNGGTNWDGDHFAVYGMAKRAALEQESLWARDAVSENRQDLNGE